MLPIRVLQKEESPYGDLAGLLGYGLGSGIGMGINKLQEPRKIQDLMQLYNLPQEQATSLVGQPAEIQQQYLQQLQKQQDQQRRNQVFNALLGGDVSQVLSQPGSAQISPQREPQQMSPSQQQKLSNDEILAMGAQLLSPQEFNALEKIIHGQEKREQHEEGVNLKKRSMSQKEIADRQKAAAPIIKNVVADYKTAKDLNSTLRQMEELNREGNFSSPVWVNSLRKVGLDWDSLLTNDDVTLQKLRNEFLPKMKSLFGGKVSNQEMEQFMKGIPDLTQSKQGRKKLIDIFKLMNEGPKIKYQALQEIREKSGERLPYNIDLEISKRADKKLDKLADKLVGLHSSPSKIVEQQRKPITFEDSIFGFNAPQEKASQQPQENKFVVGSTFEALPDAKQLSKGTTIQDEETGRYYRNTGSGWEEISIK